MTTLVPLIDYRFDDGEDVPLDQRPAVSAPVAEPAPANSGYQRVPLPWLDADATAALPAGPATDTRPAPEPDTASLPPVTALADQTQVVTDVLRAAVEAGLAVPVTVTVTRDGVVAWLHTEDLLAWTMMFPRRPKITTFAGSGYVRLSGQIGGITWRLHNEHQVPVPELRRPWSR